MYRVMAFAFLAATVGSCGEAASTADQGASPAEFAQTSSQNEQVEEMAENKSGPTGQVKPPKAAVAPSKAGKKPAVPPGQVIKPSPIVAPAEIDPVPPPVEDAQPESD
ncbi:hypothetical protein LZ496_13620 [Sphingomonas sp. NSE70-1]|uniref:Secreted protein n=1 Tax=Sphingomonas caseinilyticus TaxID=2908205 RepID=A0ABT0RXS0_9SPHN|nr:hypothetical protein [Sphingomonas caseinilyticus]MCL6699815.1 hypothetical protein [Sphingomonas caseinilyticus]